MGRWTQDRVDGGLNGTTLEANGAALFQSSGSVDFDIL